jgi:hypothetical protein
VCPRPYVLDFTMNVYYVSHGLTFLPPLFKKSVLLIL